MQYMLLIYNDETWWERLSEEEGRALMGEYFAYTDDLRSAGAFVSGEPLQPTTTAAEGLPRRRFTVDELFE